MSNCKYNKIVGVLSLIIVSYIEYIAIEISLYSPFLVIRRNPIYQITGLAVLLLLNGIVRIILKKKCFLIVEGILLFIMTFLFPAVSYWANILHGTPFTFSDLNNAKTALNVIDSYIPRILSFDKRYVVWILAFSVCFGLLIVVEKISDGKSKLSNGITLTLSIAYILLSFFVLIPKNAVSWSLLNAAEKYGYVPSLISVSISEVNAVKEPDGYSKEEIDEIISNNKKSSDASENKPDIIVILNESFYDLDKAVDIENDVTPISYMRSLDNSLMGYAVVPNEGGGTNMSEYELLTSNSLALMQSNITPFYNLDFKNANSVVSLLKEQGYTTLGAHNCVGDSYNRISVYNELGFDEIYFEKDFEGLTGWGNRGIATDESSYDDILSWYDNMGDEPRLVYFLTFQNHGSWDSNDYNQNPVHVKNDYGELTDQLSEFNSCIYYSDKAVKMLVDHFDNSERDVILLMVGDHCPGLLSSLIEEYYPDYNSDERELNVRSVPFFVWSNNPDLLDVSMESKTMSMPYLIPKVLAGADVNVSDWYSFISKMSSQVPVFTKYGAYYDDLGKKHNYGDLTLYSDLLDDYFKLEYANVMMDGHEEFFR